MTVLSRFTQQRNWLLARLRGSLSIYHSSQWRMLPPDMEKDAKYIEMKIYQLVGKMASSWEEQKTYFQSKDLNKNMEI